MFLASLVQNQFVLTIEEVEAYIAKNHHLPGMPSASTVEAEGSFELGETIINHQIKIEEIFLHLIKLEKEVAILESLLLLQEILNKVQPK